MRIVVTGGAGFIGSHVVDLLLQKNHTVLVLDNFSTGKMDNLTGYSLEHSGLIIKDCDIVHLPNTMGSCLPFKPDGIVHLAAQSAITTAMENPVKDATVNILGTLNMLNVATRAAVSRFVFSSTSAVYEKSNKKLREKSKVAPSDPYGISKSAAEFYIRTVLPERHVILRYGNVYGPRQTPIGENQVVARMIRHFKFGDEFYIHGDGEQLRDYVFVKDVAEATVSALFGKTGTFNIATGSSFSVNEMAKFLEDAYHANGYPWDHTDIQDPRRAVHMDPGLAYKKLDWFARTKIRDGIQKTVDWWEAS